MNETTIGVDVSKDWLDAHRWPDGASGRFANDRQGHKALIRWIGSAPVARVVFEPTGPYHRGLARSLAEAGLPAAAVNPWQARRFAEGAPWSAIGPSDMATGRRAKTDPIDAAPLARLGALLEPETRAPASPAIEALRELRLARAALLRDRTAARNREPHLTLALLKRQNRARLAAIDRELRAVDAAIAAVIAEDENLARAAAILVSIPGISAVTAAAVPAEMPELGSLAPGAAASLGGLAPITRRSGKWQGRAAIRGGRAGLRRALYMAALTASGFNPDLKAVHDRLLAAGKARKLALVAVMRKLLLLANALLRDGRTWCPNAP